ncbi:hypothetical protein [Nostoc sp. PCC 7107]|uniref:hypothetical protein n=1 Tax=Nostoc sp. PCC 7107 TaxID=317936 RepID=UPI00029F11CE|nr:hypothetical protein [Nostoc sp. PCC 7107]AFY45611.1 hypothetical protein Nos7107_5096 [Nostoc sp. PCC 7107]
MRLSNLTASLLTIVSMIFTAGIATAQTPTDNTSANTKIANITTHGQVITTAINSYMSPSNVNTVRGIQPFNLVYLAYQGNLKSQGIPSGSTLISQHQIGNLNAKDLVQAAVKAKKLPNQFLHDYTYLSAVDVQLSSLQKTFLR